MRALSLAVALILASAAAYAGKEPTDHPTQTEKVMAPQSLVFVVCRVDDLTGTRPPPGTPGAEVMPAPGWKDLELRVVDGEYQCKRMQIDLEDAVAMHYPRKPYQIAGVGAILGAEPSCVERETAKGTVCVDPAPVTGSLYAEPLNPKFGYSAQCVRTGVMQGQGWNEKNPGWAVVGIGCPVRMMNTGPDGLKGTADDYLIGWKLPECPDYLPGTSNPMRCKFDESLI